jgi:hypothetical protein
MKASELRIGNLINRKDLFDGHLRIETVIKLGQKIITSGPTKVICEYNDILPITLTEEWLVKFGLEKVIDCEYRKGNLIFQLTKYESGNLVTIFLNGNLINIIEYVHQLQNLYFALTNEELTIK